MIGFGNAGAGVLGFGLSCVVLLIAKASYDRRKAAGRRRPLGVDLRT
jgi:hypothetical protein